MTGRLPVLAIGLLLILAGCTGGGGGDGASTPTVTPTTGSGGTTTGGGGGGNAGEWDPYQFRAGEFYRYEVRESGQRAGTVSWEVLSVADGGTTVTVRVNGEIDGQSFDQTVTGTPETVSTGLLGSPAGTFVLVALYSPFVGAFQGEPLWVGEGWTVSDGEDTVSYRIERTDRIAGRDVFVTVIRENDRKVWETWIDTELAFAAKTVIDDEDQEDVAVTLTEYRN